MKRILCCCLVVLSLSLCSCFSLKAKGMSSGKIGVEGYEVLTWEEKHDVDKKCSSPLVEKVVGLLVPENS